MGTCSLLSQRSEPVDRDVPKVQDLRTLPRRSFITSIFVFGTLATTRYRKRRRDCPLSGTKTIPKRAIGGHVRVRPDWFHLRASFLHLIRKSQEIRRLFHLCE